jgi:hypothetical protein
LTLVDLVHCVDADEADAPAFLDSVLAKLSHVAAIDFTFEISWLHRLANRQQQNDARAKAEAKQIEPSDPDPIAASAAQRKAENADAAEAEAAS